jgi:hypothetical protein
MQIPNINVKLYYGEKDWLGFKVYKKTLDGLNLGIETEVLKGTGHQIPNLIPEEIAQRIAQDLQGFLAN